MRTETYSQNIFDELVQYDKKTAYVRHAKSIKKIATAYCKLLFPHIKFLDEMSVENLNIFKKLYTEYCLLPAIEARSFIYEQCKLVDGEYKHNTMPEFIISDENDEETQNIDSDENNVEIRKN